MAGTLLEFVHPRIQELCKETVLKSSKVHGECPEQMARYSILFHGQLGIYKDSILPHTPLHTHINLEIK